MTEFEKTLSNMTSEQYIKIVEFAHHSLPEDIKVMSDDELLEELGA